MVNGKSETGTRPEKTMDALDGGGLIAAGWRQQLKTLTGRRGKRKPRSSQADSEISIISRKLPLQIESSLRFHGKLIENVTVVIYATYTTV